MISYFNHSATRGKTTRWQIHVLIFAVGFYCRAGHSAYQHLREELHLPSPAVLKRVTRKIDTTPGLNQTAIRSFMNETHPNGITIAFDEVYFQAGLKLVRCKESFITIGFNCYGTWEAASELNHFVFIRADDLAGFGCDPETNIAEATKAHDTHAEEPNEGQFPNSSVATSPVLGWCSDTEATEIIRNHAVPDQTSRMALHFLFTTPSSTSAQGIGYIECRSVTWQLLGNKLTRGLSRNKLRMILYVKIHQIY